MAKRFGKGSFKAPPPTYKSDTLLVTTTDGNVYRGNVIANAKWTKQGFLLLKNSLIKKNDTIQSNPSVSLDRQDIKNHRLLVDYDKEHYKLMEDILLPSPSQAANLVHGNDRNGQTDWTNEEGMHLRNLQ